LLGCFSRLNECGCGNSLTLQTRSKHTERLYLLSEHSKAELTIRGAVVVLTDAEDFQQIVNILSNEGEIASGIRLLCSRQDNLDGFFPMIKGARMLDTTARYDLVGLFCGVLGNPRTSVRGGGPYGSRTRLFRLKI
jgi:hypothetical protein